MEQKLKETELKLEHMADLYTREKIEKENNSTAFKSIIEQMANTRSGSPTFDKPLYTNQSFATAHCHCPSYCFGGGGDFNEEISTRIKKIEQELGNKEKELKILKINVSRQRMSPPLFTAKSRSPKGTIFSPPSSVHNTIRTKEPTPTAEAINLRTSTIAHKPKYSDLKFKQVNKKNEVASKQSPKGSPGYERQPIPKSIIKKAKNTGQINSKH